MANKNQDDFDRPITKRSARRRPWRSALMLLMLVLFIGIIFLPKILTNRGILIGLVDRFGGLAPLKLDLEQVQAGWFKPISAQGVQLKDGDGKTLISIGNIETEKGIFGWILNSSNLGTIRIANVEADVVTYDGTSNIEQALKPMLDQPSATPTDPSAKSTSYLGAIEVVDTRFNLSSRNSSQSWILNVPELSVVLPNAKQVIGPIKLQANLAAETVPVGSSQAATSAFIAIPGASADRGGTIAAEVKQTEGQPAFELRAMMDHIPLDFWHIVHARMPELPIESLNGSVSAKVAGTIVDANRWSVDVQQLETSRLFVVAPQLVGNNPAQFEQIAASGRCTLADAKLQLENGVLNCDFGSATAVAQIPWPIVTPTLTQPWLPGAVVDARGAVDLARLVHTAESLIPMRQDTKLIAGTAQFILSQQTTANGTPLSSASFELAGLKAIASGKQLSWNDPLKLQVQAGVGNDQKIQFGGLCQAEFCNLQGQGTPEAGAFNGNVDLALLQQRLSEFVDLPIKQMTGQADLKLQWNQAQPGVVVAQGELNTTPLVIASTVGGQLNEPAWKGLFNATARLENNSPTQIDIAQLDLTSEQERLTVDLREPMRLVAATATSGATLPPAAFSVQLVGDLAKWQKRGMAFQALPADMMLGGNVSLGVEGRLDMQHAEVLQATWRMQPFELSTAQVQVSESQMAGNFKGRVDTSNISSLVVEKLEVLATSFTLGATDAAAPDGSGRVGRAGFRADLSRLMKNVQSGPKPGAVLPPGGAVPTQMAASGTVEGTLDWQVNTAAASFTLDSTGKNVAFENRDLAGRLVSKIWDEAVIKAGLGGKWDNATSSLTLDTCRLEAPWINYAGTMNYKTVNAEQIIAIKGQAVYDAARVAERIQPWTGGQLQMAGQKTIPVEVLWKGKADSVGSSLAGLQAATRLGWEQARLVGINIGPADVPISVSNGQLATAAEIPVSGGVVRWDVASDLTAQDMIIYQKPMIVLENVAITPEMCQSWLKYVTPLLADATSVEGRLSLKLDQATFNPANTRNQTVVGQLLIHSAEVGPGPLSNQIITLVQQINAIRKQDFTQAVSAQKVWVKMPEQKIDFEMINGQVSHKNLNIRAGDVTISTSGTVDIDGRMELLASMPIPDDWVEKNQLLAGMRGQSLQFPVRGTLTGPQMDLQLLKQFGRQQVQQAASGLIQQQLSKGLGKLFGPPPQQPAVPAPAGQ